MCTPTQTACVMAASLQVLMLLCKLPESRCGMLQSCYIVSRNVTNTIKRGKEKAAPNNVMKFVFYDLC